MLLFSILVAGSFSLGARIANMVDPVALTAVRFAIAGVLIGALAFATGGIPRTALRAPWRYAVLGGVFAIYFVLMFEGLKTADPVDAAAVFTLTPVLTAVIAWLLLRQITTAGVALGLALGAAGALWVIFDADIARLLSLDLGRGEAIYFVGCVAHAVYTPMVRKLNQGERPVVFTFGMLIAGAALLFAISGGQIARTEWLALPPLFWFTLAYLAVFASAVTFLLLQYATLRLPSAKVMAYTYLTPSVVILWEVSSGASWPASVVAIGIAMTIAALLILVRPDPRGA
ncbi:hypothetical protein POI8812_00149 [Pontivivens insulae]|uniref:EamA domain-containing protein n=2 Tax=Pontivivens insulae TaxID=1639689 RepID=A0A2R8A6J5_9RHOB|nr:hypothetical protein POI8812_00149 [Pontivivens insulae]